MIYNQVERIVNAGRERGSMRKILVINGSITEKSKSFALAKEFAELAKDSGDGGIVEYVDLSKVDYPILDAKLLSDMHNSDYSDGRLATADSVARNFAEADVYVVAVPNYNMLTSTQLVNYIHLIMREGVTYTSHNGEYEGLMTDKRAVVIYTSGGDSALGDNYSFGSRFIESALSSLGIMDIIVFRVDNLMYEDGAANYANAKSQLADLASDYLIY